MKYFLSCLILILFISGCSNRFSDWSFNHVEQGEVRGVPKERVLKYLRTARIYKDFSTVGLFDALWLSDAVRQAYVDVYAAKHLQTVQQKNELLSRQLGDNEQSITFYVLSYIPDTTIALGEKDCPWTVELQVHGRIYEPKRVQAVELSPEYTLFLNKVLSKHKSVYLVTFDRKDERGHDIISRKTRLIELRFSTVERSTMLTWYFDKNQQLLSM